MKKIANTLTPLAAVAFLGSCMVSGLGFLVTLMASVGFGGELPWAYFLRLYLPTLSIALPMAGMILFAVIFLASTRKTAEAIRPTVSEKTKFLSMIEGNEGEKREATLPKAA